MAVVTAGSGGGAKLWDRGTKIGAVVIWLIGTVMTYAALDQMTDWEGGKTLMAAVALQVVLTVGQSPVWRGRGGVISYVMLAVDAVINFGGTMAILANIDQMGSVQAITATFLDYSGDWPGWLKGLLALVAAAFVAGLPEFLWHMD